METYLETAKEVYKNAAENPQEGLCCTTTPVWQLPGLNIPKRMLEMNYGCGTTVHPRDLVNNPAILYVGVGGGMELLQFAYFSRNPNAVIGVDAVDEMLASCETNLKEAEALNSWFSRDYIDLRNGDAMDLPLEAESVNVAAQNCLFNIFRTQDLKQALNEIYRVLKPYGHLVLSDPICEDLIPSHLRKDERLRAECLTGAIPLNDYLKIITEAGFGTIEVRAKRPYRILDPLHYQVANNIHIESVEICAIKDPMPEDGPCIFTGKTAIYYGDEEYFNDGNGHALFYNQPLAVCDKTAGALKGLGRDDIFITNSTFFYDGGGCC